MTITTTSRPAPSLPRASQSPSAAPAAPAQPEPDGFTPTPAEEGMISPLPKLAVSTLEGAGVGLLSLAPAVGMMFGALGGAAASLAVLNKGAELAGCDGFSPLVGYTVGGLGAAAGAAVASLRLPGSAVAIGLAVGGAMMLAPLKWEDLIPY